jgi:hypothetical protein
MKKYVIGLSCMGRDQLRDLGRYGRILLKLIV